MENHKKLEQNALSMPPTSPQKLLNITAGMRPQWSATYPKRRASRRRRRTRKPTMMFWT